jgi:hypothetical protein
MISPDIASASCVLMFVLAKWLEQFSHDSKILCGLIYCFGFNSGYNRRPMRFSGTPGSVHLAASEQRERLFGNGPVGHMG